MAEPLARQRLQPSLLDRLTDLEPQRTQDTNESRVLNEQQLKECVRRDLAALFNSTHLQAVQDLSEYPEVSRSVVNFGIPDLAGRTLSGIDHADLERVLRDAIWAFEPRLLRRSIKIRLANIAEKSHNALAFEIEAELYARPQPLSLFLRTEFDLENASVRVVETRRGGG